MALFIPGKDKGKASGLKNTPNMQLFKEVESIKMTVDSIHLIKQLYFYIFFDFDEQSIVSSVNTKTSCHDSFLT